MTDPNILYTDAYIHMKGEFDKAINKGPTFICNICWKFEYETNVKTLNSDRYESDSAIAIYEECKTEKKSLNGKKYICNSCNRFIAKGKTPPQAQANGLALNKIFDIIDDLCPLEISLVSQIIPFMFIVPRHKGAQHGLKGQVVLVPSDFKKISKILPRSCDEGHIISLALKRRLSDKSFHHRQNIHPAAVNAALGKLIDINHLYQDIELCPS